MMQKLAGHLLAASRISSGLETRDLIPGHMHSFHPRIFSTCSLGRTSLQIRGPLHYTVQRQNQAVSVESPTVLAEGLVKEFCS